MKEIRDAWNTFLSWRLRDKFYFILGAWCLYQWMAMGDDNGRVITFFDFVIGFFGPPAALFIAIYLFDEALPKLYWKYRRWQAHRAILRYERSKWSRIVVY